MEKMINIKDFELKNKSIVFKEGAKQVLVLEVASKIYAIDNRCPHEGYPLSQGKSDGKNCVLTCNWHNWKFDLSSGKCLVGEDSVRTYPVKIENDIIRIDLSDPSPHAIKDDIMKGFKVAFDERQYGRISREISRLHYNKLDPLDVLKNSILWSYDKFEYGMTHAYAATSDWISLYKSLENEEDKIICLTEATDHIALDSLRHKTYSFIDTDEKFCYSKLQASILNEDSKKAEGLVLSGFKEGLEFKDFEETLSKVALENYNDFGHALIYVTKVRELCDTFKDKAIDKALTLSLVRGLCYSTKENLLPEFKKYTETLKLIEDNVFGKGTLIEKIQQKKSVNNTYDWLIKWSSKCKVETIFEELVLSNAQNFLTYDLKYQNATHNSVSQNVGWLHFTHAITFSNAVRRICEKFPTLWAKGLIQMASFSGRNGSYTTDISLSDWCISLPDFKDKSTKIILDHGFNHPIFSSHILKTSIATIEEAEYFNNKEVSKVLTAAMNRFVSSPLKQKHIRRSTHQAMNLVSKNFM